jgi:hypothetical protein
MAPAAFIGRHLVSRYLFDLVLDEDQRKTAFFTVNKHWAPLVFHGRTPTVLVVSYLTFIVACGKELSIRLKKGGLNNERATLLLFELLKLAG